MGKATNPAKARHKAIEDAGGVERLYHGTRLNHRASPLSRWKLAGQLTDAHLCAIAWCQKRWALIGHDSLTTAGYGERTSRSTADGESGATAIARMEARDDLKRVAGGIGLSGQYEPGYIPRPYWAIFENCIRFDEPAGVIGSSLGASAPSARALTVVQFVADIIVMKEGLVY